MECKKCGSKWESGINLKACPFCGESLEEEKAENINYEDMSEVLKYIVNTYGIDIYKKPKLLLSYISDFAPKLSAKQRLIKMCIPSGIIEQIADNINSAEQEQELFMMKSVKYLCDEYYIAEAAANELMAWLTYGAGWNVKIYSNQDDENDSHQESTKSDKAFASIQQQSKKQDKTDICQFGRETISAGRCHTVGLKSDGTVVAVGYNEDGRCNVGSWRDIVAVSAGSWHTVGLKSDGTVVAVGFNKDRQSNAGSWRHIIAVSAGSWHTVGIKSDGTVVAVGENDYGQCDVGDWKDMVAATPGYMHTVGIKSDGTVVAVGDNEHGECDVSSWRDIVAVSAGAWHTVGLKSDGTVVAVGDNDHGQCNVSSWRDILAVSTGYWHTVGIESDGTVVTVGRNDYGQCDVSSWRDIVAVSAGAWHTVGLKSDGTVVAVGYNEDGRCNVGSWRDITVPKNEKS